jgi:hypothetical protein
MNWKNVLMDVQTEKFVHYDNGVTYEKLGVTERPDKTVQQNFSSSGQANGSFLYATHSETKIPIAIMVIDGKMYYYKERLVVYVSEKDGKIWAGPHDMFYENVEKDGQIVPRFARINS